MTNQTYEIPWIVKKSDECHFYYRMDLPGIGMVGGDWDFQNVADSYTGRFDFDGTRVLDVGASSGFFSFLAENRGATEVVAFDIADNFDYDTIDRSEYAELWAVKRQVKRGITRFKNAFWMAHKALNSKVKVVYGDIYDIPTWIGNFDFVLLGSVLLHVRSPYDVLKSVARFVKMGGTISVTDADAERTVFMPNFPNVRDVGSWWLLNSQTITRMLSCFGIGQFKEERFVTHAYIANYDQKMLNVTGTRIMDQKDA